MRCPNCNANAMCKVTIIFSDNSYNDIERYFCRDCEVIQSIDAMEELDATEE